MKGRKLWMRVIIILVVALVIWVACISSKQIERNKRIEKEVATLSEEAEKIRRENETLTDRISYFSSNEFREQEAKEKLGLKKPNETVVVIKQEPVPTSSEGEAAEKKEGERMADNMLPNYRKWWNLFFDKI